ncbi:MAG: DNA-protecting protein DprA [Candidatus Sungbacteria bacterium]|nr:DNA-protecting protein DprA [Candidatus Sungbacteria bacterium]
MHTDLKFLHALNSIPGVGSATLRLLREHFGSYEQAWAAAESALRQLALPPGACDAIVQKRSAINPNRAMDALIRSGIWIVTENDSEYPALLRQITQPPVILYGRGNAKSLTRADQSPGAFAVVGTRRPTQQGLEAVDVVVRPLVEAGFTIVSGLAVGIDARSHRAALDTKGITVAIVGSGIDDQSLFPQENVSLSRRIQESGGAVISEYAPGTPGLKEHFPQRNRIISGLSRGVLVVEARERSGALITSRFALDQNREVFAVPGSLFSPISRGTNLLIQQGAKLVLSAEDILSEFGMEATKQESSRSAASLDQNQKSIAFLLDEPLGVDEIKERTGFETPLILATLSLLELKGIVKNLGQDVYQRISG